MHPFISMQPVANPGTVLTGGVPESVTPWLLAANGKAYALYLRKSSSMLKFSLPAGRYRIRAASPAKSE